MTEGFDFKTTGFKVFSRGEGLNTENPNIFIEIWGVLVYNILGFA